MTTVNRALYTPTETSDSKFRDFRDAFLLPGLNLEDLTGPKALLVLFQVRARNEPDVFAFSDSDACEEIVA
jgi:hypothetical protein